MKKIFYFIFVFAAPVLVRAQNIFPSTGTAGIGTTTPAPSAALEIKSTTQGLLIPRMTKIQRDAIPSPRRGLMIFQTNSTPGFYYFDGSSWEAVSVKGPNTALSNLSSPTAINADMLPNADNAMNLGSPVLGWKALYVSGSIYTNGNRFISNNATSTWLGLYTGLSSTGPYNSAVGYSALYSNASGSSNTAIGYSALYGNTTGSNNIAIGQSGLYSNTTGFNNIAVGFGALYANGTGASNNAYGYKALLNNTTGYSNVAVGVCALYTNSNRSNLVALGDSALFNNGDSVDVTQSQQAAYNTAVGSKALYANNIGFRNTANGYNALYSNTTGFDNTASGYNTLYSNIGGYANTAMGAYALDANTIGSGNTALGEYADVQTGNLSNATAIGAYTTVDASDKVRVGNTTVTSIGGQVSWTSFSDGRYKKNIKEDVKGLAFINILRPITYTIDVNSLNEDIDKGREHDGTYKKMKSDMQPSADEASKIVYNGFIAQDVESAAKKLNYDFSGVDKPPTKDGLYGLRYSDFVVPLVKAVQELSKANDEKDAKIDNLQKQIDDLKGIILSGNQNNTTAVANLQKQNINITGALLEQNTPNPFSSSTIIHYTLPQSRNTGSTAQIIITDRNGKLMKQVNLSGNGKGAVNIDAATLSSGAYTYALYVDGKFIGSKQMILVK